MRRLIIILTLTTSLTASGQGLTDNMTMGLNLPPLIGHTFDLKIEKHPRPHWTYQWSAGLMINNKLRGTYYKVGDGIKDRSNSGAFTSIGARFNTRKEINKSAYFIGYKLIGGYFVEKGSTPDDINKPIRNTGLFAAAALETGTTIRFTNRFHLDIGFQYSLPFYTDDQVSIHHSVLPGIGAIQNLQGIVTPKFYIGQWVD